MHTFFSFGSHFIDEYAMTVEYQKKTRDCHKDAMPVPYIGFGHALIWRPVSMFAEN